MTSTSRRIFMEAGLFSSLASVSQLGSHLGSVADSLGAPFQIAHSPAEIGQIDTTQAKLAFLTGLGREGWFCWRNGDYRALLVADQCAGVFIASNADTSGRTGAWVRANDGRLSPGWFGQCGEGVDSAPAIQAAINLAQVIFHLSGAFAQVQLPAGVIEIRQPVVRSGNGKYVDILGSGQRNTIVRAAAPMDTMLVMSSEDEIQRSTRVSGITFDCNRLADRGVDARGMRKWTFEGNEVRHARSECMRGGNWNTRILNNVFEFSPVGFRLDGRQDAQSASNNFVFALNDVNNCDIGLSVEHKANDLQIEQNSFDYNRQCAILITSGCRSFRIIGNFLERCGEAADGQGSGVPVTIDAQQTRHLSAAVIINHFPTAPAATPSSGTIEGNLFANCNKRRLVILTNVADVVTRGNKVHDSYTSEAFVELLGPACGTSCQRLEMEEALLQPLIGQILKLNGANPVANHMNICVANFADRGAEPRPIGPVWNDLSSRLGERYLWTGAEKLYFGEHEGSRLVRFSPDDRAELDIALEPGSSLWGRYLRLHGQSRGGDGRSSGLVCEVFLDDASNPIISQKRQSRQFEEFGRGITFMVPSGIRRLRIRLTSATDAADVELKHFCVCDAAIPLHQTPVQ